MHRHAHPAARVDGEEGEGGGDNDECKIEGGAIGQDGVQLLIGAKAFACRDWVAKTGEPNELVDFALTIDNGGSFSCVVKAGGELHPSSELVWLHPAPDGADKAPAISNVDGCDDPDNDGGTAATAVTAVTASTARATAT